jgi:hypothetical protein
LNRDLRPVLQNAFVSSPHASALNLFISGIPYDLDSYRRFTTAVYAVFPRTNQRIPIPPGNIEDIIAFILSKSETLGSYLRDRLDSVQGIATVAIDEPEVGMNLAEFNAEGVLLNGHQLEVIHNSHQLQRLSQAQIMYDQLVYPLIFWIGSGGRGLMESEKLQGSGTLIRRMLISLILQPREYFIHQFITLREEFICAGFGRLINLKIKFVAQA